MSKTKTLTVFWQFFLNLSQPNARIAPAKPNTCESIQAARYAIVFPGLSTLYTTFSTTLLNNQKMNSINNVYLIRL